MKTEWDGLALTVSNDEIKAGVMTSGPARLSFAHSSPNITAFLREMERVEVIMQVWLRFSSPHILFWEGDFCYL
jgi:hypothetical protein